MILTLERNCEGAYAVQILAGSRDEAAVLLIRAAQIVDCLDVHAAVRESAETSRRVQGLL